MQDLEELEEVLAETLDVLGLKAAGLLVFDNSCTRMCLNRQPCPHVVVCSDDREQLDKTALQLNLALGVMVKKELCDGFLVPLPFENWVNRGR